MATVLVSRRPRIKRLNRTSERPSAGSLDEPPWSVACTLRGLWRVLSLLMITLSFGVVFLGVYGIRRSIEPQITNVRYFQGGQPSTLGTLPLSVESKGAFLTVQFSAVVPRFGVRVFHFDVDDCLEQLLVNHKSVPLAANCGFQKASLELNDYLKHGQNEFIVRVRDRGGEAHFSMISSRLDPRIVLINFSLVFISVLYFLLMAAKLEGRSAFEFIKKPTILFRQHKLVLVCAVGIALRIWYFASTPFDERAHDVGGHLEYIQYVANFYGIPPASLGWETHQAPLYYVVSAALLRLASLLVDDRGLFLALLQTQSLLYGIGTLLVLALVGRLLFQRQSQKRDTELLPGASPMDSMLVGELRFLLTAAVVPALVFLSARITNNSLYTFFSVLTVYYLIRWWQNGRRGDWSLHVLSWSAAFLTKVAALSLLPLSLSLLLLRRETTGGERLRLAFVAVTIGLFLTAWYPIYRLGFEADVENSLTFGKQHMPEELQLDPEESSLLRFNPFRLLEQPYNDTYRESSRRQNFLEFIFRSALFGEFQFSPSLRTLNLLLLLNAICLIPFFFLGLLRLIREKDPNLVPAILLLLSLGAAQLWYRVYAPFVPNQDIRFSLTVLVSIIFLITAQTKSATLRLRGIGAVALVERLGICLQFSFVLLALLFLSSVYFFEPG